jgi:Tol biopolymer transport system component
MHPTVRVAFLLVFSCWLLAQGESSSATATSVGLNGLIAFTSNRDGNSEIYVMNSDGSGVRRLTAHTAQDGTPAWSPDGSKVAFWSDRGGSANIYVLDVASAHLARLTTLPSGEPVWSPDGKLVASSALGAGERASDIYVVNADGTNLRQLTAEYGSDSSPDWSPDGALIAFTSSRNSIGDPHPSVTQIFKMTSSGDVQSALTNSHIDTTPSWSPDGTGIAFGSDRAGSGDIYVIDVAGGEPLRLTDSDAFDRDPTWSPDGTKIAFVSSRDGNAEIYVMNADGSGAVNISNSSGSEDNAPSWQPLLAGDVSCAGGVNSIDAALLLQFEAGLLAELSCLGAADVNTDGQVDSRDAALILQVTAGLLPQPSPTF